MTALTLQALVSRAREEGWHVSLTTNVHMDRADWPAGTGAILVEAFDEDGNPALYAAGTTKEGTVEIGGDKLNERKWADTVEGVLEWARYTWDSPEDPLPAIFGPPLPPGFVHPDEPAGDLHPNDDFDRLYSIAESMILDDIKDLVRDQMVQWGWAEDHEDHYTITELGREKLREEEDG